MFDHYQYLYGRWNNYERKILKKDVNVVSNYSTADRFNYKHNTSALFNKWVDDIKGKLFK